MSDLHALAERLEKATEGSRNLDIAIWRALVNPATREPITDEYHRIIHPDTMPPQTSSSLDAAVALCERVLPGWEWLAGSNNRVSMTRRDGNSPIILADAPTPALALCLAVVRAKIAATPEMGVIAEPEK